MDNYILRLSSINLNNAILILKELNNLNDNKIYEKSQIINNEVSELRHIFLDISEELESAKIDVRYNALSKLFFLFIKDPDFNFMLNDKLDENFEVNYLSQAFHCGVLNDLIKNLSFFYYRFSEYNK